MGSGHEPEYLHWERAVSDNEALHAQLTGERAEVAALKVLPGGAPGPALVGGLGSAAAAPGPQPGSARAGLAWWVALLVALAAAAVLLLAGIATYLLLRRRRKQQRTAAAALLPAAAAKVGALQCSLCCQAGHACMPMQLAHAGRAVHVRARTTRGGVFSVRPRRACAAGCAAGRLWCSAQIPPASSSHVLVPSMRGHVLLQRRKEGPELDSAGEMRPRGDGDGSKGALGSGGGTRPGPEPVLVDGRLLGPGGGGAQMDGMEQGLLDAPSRPAWTVTPSCTGWVPGKP